MLRGRRRWVGVMWEDLSMEKFIMREENFHEGAARFSSIKKNTEKKISAGSKEQH